MYCPGCWAIVQWMNSINNGYRFIEILLESLVFGVPKSVLGEMPLLSLHYKKSLFFIIIIRYSFHAGGTFCWIVLGMSLETFYRAHFGVAPGDQIHLLMRRNRKL